MKHLRIAIGTLAIASATALPAAADCADYFDAQRFTLVVPYGAGGGFDAYARTFAPVFEDMTGATVQISNITGGGGTIGAGRIATAKADDRVFGFLSSGRAYGYQSEFPTTPRLTPLAGVLLDYEVWIAAADASLEDLMETGVVSGGSSIYSGITDAAFPAKALGIDVSLVSGYDGSAESSAAILRGEVDISGRSSSSALKARDTGEFKILMTLTDKPVEGLGVPALGELAAARAAGASPEDRAKRLKFAELAGKMTQGMRAFWASADLEPEALACLTDAVSRAVESEAYFEAAAAIKRPVEPIAQADAAVFFDGVVAAFEESGPLVEELRDTLE